MTSIAPLAQFEEHLRSAPDPAAALRNGLIGAEMQIDTPSGSRKLVYADYVASGRALRQIEDFIRDDVLPFYANTHTESSLCGARSTALREASRSTISRLCGSNVQDHAVLFTGSGATAGLNHLVHLLDIPASVACNTPVTVLTGPYEHHSNLLPWRESGAKVEEIPEGAGGGPDMVALNEALMRECARGRVIVAMSAASNVTGICVDVAAVTGCVKDHGATMVWDYAAGAPYLSMDMQAGGAIDAIVFSPHKFIGGPGASGVLIVRRDAVRSTRPLRTGGGTVAFVNERVHDYLPNLEHREEGGTPAIIGDIRAALVLIVKDVMGQDWITRRNHDLTQSAFAAWGDNPNIGLLAPDRRDRLPIFSFAPAGDPSDFTRALSELYGIQARGGCACAGPYAHHLLGIGPDRSNVLRDHILAGHTAEKPGFVRLNFSVLMTPETVQYILDSVARLAENRCNRAA